MSQITVRTATLDDAQAITRIHRSNITRWQRLNEQGEVEDVPYEKLSVYERWLHGGPWMSVETCAVHLTHLLRGAGIPLVAAIGKRVLGHGEVFHGVEPPPFGDHLHIAVLYVHAESAGRGLEAALLAHVAALGRELGCQRVCVSHAGAGEFYEGEKWRRLASGQRVEWPARPGQVFYQATPHPQDDPAQIRGLMMPLGRFQNAVQEWVTRWPELWAGVPELHARRVERLKFTVAGASLFVLYAESPYDPRRASVYAWMPTLPGGPVLAAINDRAHKLGFRRLDSYVLDEHLKLLGPEAEPDGYTQELYSLEL